MGYPKSNFKKGVWRAQCDRCGFDYHSDQLKKEWNGLYTCKECWEPRHPQDFVKGVKDDQSVSWTRPEPADTENYICNSRSAVSGVAQSGCMIAGVSSTDILIPSGTFNNDL